jgi:hypothetical protein
VRRDDPKTEKGLKDDAVKFSTRFWTAFCAAICRWTSNETERNCALLPPNGLLNCAEPRKGRERERDLVLAVVSFLCETKWEIFYNVTRL